MNTPSVLTPGIIVFAPQTLKNEGDTSSTIDRTLRNTSRDGMSARPSGLPVIEFQSMFLGSGLERSSDRNVQLCEDKHGEMSRLFSPLYRWFSHYLDPIMFSLGGTRPRRDHTVLEHLEPGDCPSLPPTYDRTHVTMGSDSGFAIPNNLGRQSRLLLASQGLELDLEPSRTSSFLQERCEPSEKRGRGQETKGHLEQGPKGMVESYAWAGRAFGG
ncbi:hypothetical protein RRG08_049076 [Elysia crispata]|uniref:Uncharacterized protein n=1 Tax=Elysia crispata TaxID=231223 RepID=A0AAE1ABH0_9GAST|nr:hypothetical protein RRG08_049076 [Elysia crispata]